MTSSDSAGSSGANATAADRMQVEARIVECNQAMRSAPWVRRLPGAVWITGQDRRIAWCNENACKLLGIPSEGAVQETCYGIVCGRDVGGDPFCSKRCSVVVQADLGHPINMVTLQIGPDEANKRWVQVLAIPVESAEDGSLWLVHCAIDAEREHRMKEQLENMALGGNPRRRVPVMDHPWNLTPRESQVLSLLADGLDLHALSARLHVSHATVRNHVQHIIDKLGVHSRHEAVALFLLDTGFPSEPPHHRF